LHRQLARSGDFADEPWSAVSVTSGQAPTAKPPGIPDGVVVAGRHCEGRDSKVAVLLNSSSCRHNIQSRATGVKRHCAFFRPNEPCGRAREATGRADVIAFLPAARTALRLVAVYMRSEQDKCSTWRDPRRQRAVCRRLPL
jgi:hypothetical protein